MKSLNSALYSDKCYFVFLSQRGVGIFTKRVCTNDQSQLNPDDVIKYLGRHSQALLLYLEHLVVEKKTQVQEMTPR